ncbi:hypothetical protein CONPUDRAFT_152053 [Coniophora puteana RWD-64-598 SS2]|uniref:BRCT domain-containing protein n=1 Tax=Coniophora puteana (strain RWD-64-598) TaxID=741705 RepID=A0A5M3MV41_CONPW|nr:uncharacterized protein CONPUDRAFT_152053 [Coniophora puteana RWD-64-598 SS2]EIW83009.1 hypothetical protein CONPUDRAFT_152053 [Coniophora puteana RWD-64-598 SS2]
MAPARSSRRPHPDQHQHQQQQDGPTTNDSTNPDPASPLFLDPMMGTPLTVYIEKDVHDRDILVELVTKYSGAVSPGYSGTPYILVDPSKESGQNLYRQYAGKKGKIVLDARWIHECIRAGALQTYHTNYAGCKVTGQEKVISMTATPSQEDSSVARTGPSAQSTPLQPQAIQQPSVLPTVPPDQLVQPSNTYGYPVYSHPLQAAPRTMPSASTGPQPWQGPSVIAPQQTHMAPPPAPGMLSRPTNPYRDDSWGTDYTQPPPPNMVGAPTAAPYDYRYREEQPEWSTPAGQYSSYEPAPFEQYGPPAPYVPEPGPSAPAGPSASPPDVAEKPRGRKRTRNSGTPTTLPSALVLNRRNPTARSPTPPRRVIKSTYGGNLFTSDDVLYLKKYIDYCQEQGLVLSLREICERVAVKAPHHTFYSWRRYCNKHQIRLGGYSMDTGGQSNSQDDQDGDEEIQIHSGAAAIAAAQQRLQQESHQPRNRSPTPPRALFRSTTGKGVAFTDEDVGFLVRFMEYRRSQGRLDMVAFWKDVAAKAPHHSRASWMKFWRRHKHELNRMEGDEPLPQPPEKKMRYSRADDILLARYFYNKPDGTSDRIFQAFGRMYPHHPWKGWQEHHRIHKAKIDHLISKLASGENIEGDEDFTQTDA